MPYSQTLRHWLDHWVHPAPAPAAPWWRWRGLTRQERVRARKLALTLIPTMVVILFLAFGTEYIGYPKVGGQSMAGPDGAIQQPFFFPFGPTEIRHRGAYVHVESRLEPTVGSIVMFRHDKERDIKRVEKIRKDGAVWAMADNVGVTGMDSREYGWISRADVVGVVDRIITPQRIWRSLTAEGRFRNEMSFRFGPKARWFTSDRLVLAKDGAITLFKKDGTTLNTVRGELALESQTPGTVAYTPPDEGGRRWELNLQDGTTKRAEYGLRIVPFNNSPANLSLAGDVPSRLKPGTALLIDGRPVTVKSVSLKQGGPAGVSTVVEFAPQLQPQPTGNSKVALAGNTG